jgi:hypothetical protein
MGDNTRHNWTAERVDQLRALRAEGRSAAYIAEQLGFTTRNAVIGKLHRLGLYGAVKPRPGPWDDLGISRRTYYRQRRQTSVQPALGQGEASKDYPPVYRRDWSGTGFGFVQVAIGRFATELTPSTPKRDPIGIMALLPSSCRWPVEIEGEPMLYCGAKALRGHSWCGEHCERAYLCR